MIAAASADPRIPLVSTVPASFDDRAGRQFLDAQRHRLQDGFGYSFVIAGLDDAGVGSIGLWLRDLDLGRVSVGYWVVPSARGQGAAATALGAVARWALTTLAIGRVELVVEPDNTPSIRTAARAGFVREGLLRSLEVVGGRRTDLYMYSLITADL